MSLPNTDIINHTLDGVEYQIMPDLGMQDTDQFKYIVVIGSFPEGRYRQPMCVSIEFMQEPKYLDRTCVECRRLMRKFSEA